jgi:hypothetical protein
MRRSLSLATAAVVSAILTQGMVFSAMNLADSAPVTTYRGSFQHAIFALERVWSGAHGRPPLSDIDDFGRFYTQTVHLLCPLLGFALFWILSRHRVGRNLWKPLAIALLLALPPLGPISDEPLRAIGRPWSEMVRTLLILFFMLWSAGAIRLNKIAAAIEPSDDSRDFATPNS